MDLTEHPLHHEDARVSSGEPRPESIDGARIELWLPGGEAQVLDWADLQTSQRGIVWIDLGLPVDWSAVRGALLSSDLEGLQPEMIGHFLNGIGPEEPGAGSVEGFDASVAAELARNDTLPRYLRFFGLQDDVQPGPWAPPWIFRQDVGLLVGSTWLVTARYHGSASDGLHVNQAKPFPLAELRKVARLRWDLCESGPELAILVMRALVESFGSSLSAIDKRLRHLQQGFIRRLSEPHGGGNVDEAGYRDGLVWLTLFGPISLQQAKSDRKSN